MEDLPTRIDLEDQITELKKQNEVLRLHALLQQPVGIIQSKEDVEESSQTIFNNMGDSVFVKDDQSRLILVNDAFCDMFHLPRADILGKTLAEHVNEDERESFLSIDNQVLSDGIENINEETLTLGGGQPIIISTRKSRFVDVKGDKFLVGVIRDITKRKEAEVALSESETNYKELNATKDRLFSIIAHDLRGPFSSIIAVTELLYKNAGDTAPNVKFIDIINSAAKDTLVLLDDLLAWAESQTGSLDVLLEKVHLSQAIDEVVSLSKSLAQTKNISIHYVKTDEVEIQTDKNMLKTVLRNLVSNAIKFTNHEGSIEVMTAAKGNQFEISIVDNGIGMSAETIQNLFEISTNFSLLGTANERGSGLGLVLCKEFVERLGGRICVESELGEGSTFTFNLPLG
ncbi:MAG: PAS domain S-box-containing protein [Flavobacteriales bacterium]|jgi:PAS domain S-box-containing protein